MSRQSIGFHCAIIKELAPDVLEIVEKSFATQNLKNVANENDMHVAEDATHVAWQFSWFRHITPLPHRYQHHIVNRIIENADKTTTKLVEGWSKLFKRRSVLEQYIRDNVPQEHIEDYLIALDTSTYDKQMDNEGNPNDSLKAVIEQLKRESCNRLEYINCLELIPTLQDKSIDCLITDPPYGIEVSLFRRAVRNKNRGTKFITRRSLTEWFG